MSTAWCFDSKTFIGSAGKNLVLATQATEPQKKLCGINPRCGIQAGAEGYAVSDVLPELTRQGPGASFYGGEIARQGATQF